MSKQAAASRHVFTHQLFGVQVRQWRLTIQLTERQLADMVGVSSVCIAHAETGRTPPSVSSCKKLAHALGVRELEMLAATGVIGEGEEKSDNQYMEPEVRVFFRDVWPRMNEDERGVVSDYLQVMRVRVERRCCQAGLVPFFIGSS
jgi:transcriptional regulator with XRE-family HTH domain